MRLSQCGVAPEIEIEGLDVPEFGLLGYPEDPMVTATAASAGAGAGD
jgi:hypothetical protein